MIVTVTYSAARPTLSMDGRPDTLPTRLFQRIILVNRLSNVNIIRTDLNTIIIIEGITFILEKLDNY